MRQGVASKSHGCCHLLVRIFKVYHRFCRRIERWREIARNGGASHFRYSRNEITAAIMYQVE